MSANKSSTVVPWRTPEQFHHVYRSLYSPSISDKRWAIDQISVWDTRCHPALPTAIEATDCLVRVVIQDMLYEAEKTFCIERDIRNFYSMALIRFVNLIIEIDQKGPSKIRMSILAEKLKIPSWIVELRHEASHSVVPSLPVLRMGAEEALKYLEDTFWKVEASNIRAVVNYPMGEEQDISILLSQYRNIQFCRLEQRAEKEALMSDLKQILQKLRTFTKTRRCKKKLIETLLEPGVFLCPKDLLRLLHVSGKVFLENADDPSLPTNIVKFWRPLIRLLHRVDLIPTFLEKLMISMEKCTNQLCQKVAVAWVTSILIATAQQSATQCPLWQCFQEKGVVLNLHRLLHACMRGVNKYSLNLLELIVGKLGNKEKYWRLFWMVALYQRMAVLSNDDVPQKKRKMYFTADDMEEDLVEEHRKRIKTEKDVNVWSRAPVSMDFSEMALGVVLNPVHPENEFRCFAEEPRMDVDNSTMERFIIGDERDNEETVEEKVTSDKNVWEIPETFDMVYRRREKK